MFLAFQKAIIHLVRAPALFSGLRKQFDPQDHLPFRVQDQRLPELLRTTEPEAVSCNLQPGPVQRSGETAEVTFRSSGKTRDDLVKNEALPGRTHLRMAIEIRV